MRSRLLCRIEAFYLTFLSPQLWALRFRLMFALKRWVSINADGHHYMSDGKVRYEVIAIENALVERKYMDCIRCGQEGLVEAGPYYGDRVAGTPGD